METIDLSPLTHKCVLVVEETLPAGVIANISAVLSMTIGKEVPQTIGGDVTDATGSKHCGITRLPVPILGATKDIIRSIRQRLEESGNENTVMVDFTTLAQSCRTYEEYTSRMAETPESDLEYIGLGIFAHKKIVNKCTGSLKLIR